MQLDASGSISVDGRPLTYQWSLVSRPAGSAAGLSNPSALRPTFTVDVAGDYVFALTTKIADDATAIPATAQVTMSTANVSPVADAGLNRHVTLGATVALDGARSFDADGDAITYSWILIKKPLGSLASLDASANVRPTFRIDVPGAYVAELVVTDANGRRSEPSRVAFSTRADALAGKASAGPSQSLAVGATARLDADGTYFSRAERDSANVAWALLYRPAASATALVIGDDARQALTVDAAGDYVVQAMLRGASKCSDDDDFDDGRWLSQKDARAATTLVTTGNVPPVADAGPEQGFLPGAVVTLDGSKSTDANGDLITYRWSLIRRPSGSHATLDDAGAVRPKFTADIAGTYVAQLVVDDGHGAARPSTVVVTSEASRPIADAGSDQLGKPGAAVALDGSHSSDVQGSLLSANWTILGLGDQPTVGSLSTPTKLTTNFNIPSAGMPLTQAVFIEPAALPLAKGEDENGGPRGVDLDSVGRLSKDGTPYTIWRIRNVTKNGRVATLDSEGASFSITLTIPAKSDLFVASPIVNGTATHRLMANGQVYEVVDALAATFADTRLVGGGPALKLSIIQLTATNALLRDFDDVVVSTVEARPVAVLHATSPTHRGGLVQLDGSLSRNPNAPAALFSGLTYKWALLSRPAGSGASLTDPTAAIASFSPDVYGLYVAQLIVSDGKLASRPRTIVVDVAPRKPIAAASTASPVSIGQIARLDGTGSLDPDGNALAYSWSFVSIPTGSHAALSNATAAVANFTPDIAGTYVAELVVSDAHGVSAPVQVSILAQGGLAFTTSIGSQQVSLGSRLTFTIHASDPNGKPVAYSIEGPLPAGATFDTVTGAFAFRPPTNDPASLTFVFHATNGKDIATLRVPVAITGAASGTTGSVAAHVYDAVDFVRGVFTPVENVVVSSASLSGISDATGAMSISGLPAGQDMLTVSAARATPSPDGSAYLDTVVPANVIPGVTNTLDGPILLARASGSGAISGGGTTTITNTSLGVTLTIPPNSALNADGTPYNGEVSIGSLPPNTPVGLPAGFAPCQLLVISPAGVTFNPAAQLTIVNRDQLPVGALVDLWAFDPQLSTARVVGVGQVSSDRATITTIVGGVPGGAILAMMPKRVGLEERAIQPPDVFSPSVLGSGDLATSFSPPGTRQLNAGRGPTFVYHSSTANARPVIDAKTQLGPNLGLPQTITTRLSAAGVTQQTILSTDLSKPISRSAPLDAARQNSLVQAGVIDATSLASGSYPYSLLTISRYACSAVGAQSTGAVVVNNQTKSAFGAGWQLAEVQKINRQADGSLAVVEGNGRVIIAHSEQAPDFLPDPVYVPVRGPFLGATADLSGDGKPSVLRLGWEDGSLYTILNRGNRQFTKASVIPVAQPGTVGADGTPRADLTDLAVGDLNSDGSPDVAVVRPLVDKGLLLAGAGSGVFRPVPFDVEGRTLGGDISIGDWVGAGIQHAIIAHTINGEYDYHVVVNDGRGGLVFNTPRAIYSGRVVQAVTTRFPGFDHDSVVGVARHGRIDFVYGGATQSANWSRGSGDPAYAAANGVATDTLLTSTNVSDAGLSRVLATGDLDGSGNPSFALAGLDKIYIVKWLHVGRDGQRVTQTLTLPNDLNPDSVTLAPLGKGDRPSLVVTAKTAGFYVFPNDGRGGLLASPVYIPTPFRTAYETNVVDFDNDGVSDIAVNDIDNNRVAIYFGKPHSNGAFVSPIGDYTRLVQNGDGTYSRIYNDGTVVRFNKDGFQTSIVDANGNTTDYSYNGSGQLTTIVDPTGATTSFTYAGAFVATTTDGAGRTTSFEHDGAGNLTKVTDPLGNVTQYLYDANHLLLATIDPNGGKTENVYTSTGQLKQQTYPDGASVRLDVSRTLGLDALGVDLGGPTNAAFVPAESRITQMQDAKGNLSETEVNEWGAVVRVTDALDRVSRFYRDAANRVVHSETPAGTITGPIAPSSTGLPQIGSSDTLINDYLWDAAGNLLSLREAAGHPNDPYTGSVLDRTTSYVYEPTHNKLAQKIDAEGHTTRWDYDANGNMTAMTDALGGVTAYSYDARGLQLSKTDPLGHVTTYSYDTSGNLFRTTDALGNKFERYYDASGNLILSIDAVGTSIERRRASRYDSNNRVVSQTSASGEVTRREYDANGNVARVIDPAGNITTRIYDGNDRLLSETTPDAGINSFTYDENGNRLTATDASGAVTHYGYDAANRLVTITDALNATRSVTYDLRDNAVSVVNARGKETKLGYDIHKRLNMRADPAAGAYPYQYLYQYDRVDNLILTTSPTRASNGFAYDALNRPTNDNWSTYTYDAASRLITASGGVVRYDFTYDALGRRESMKAGGGYSTTVDFSYAYDALSRRMEMRDSLGGVTQYVYDAEDRVASIVTPWGGVITQKYDAAGRPQKLSYPNGLDADLSFESATGRLAGIVHRAGPLSAPIAKFDHSYDVRGNLKTNSPARRASITTQPSASPPSRRHRPRPRRRSRATPTIPKAIASPRICRLRTSQTTPTVCSMTGPTPTSGAWMAI